MGLLKKAENNLCECGCGLPTKKLNFRCPKTGLPAGAYRRFIRGHHNKVLSFRFKTGQFKRHGYVYIFSPDHPAIKTNKYISRSRLALENKIGRYLKDGEHVHHINEIRDDDRPDNLMLVTLSEHNKIHNKQQKMISARW